MFKILSIFILALALLIQSCAICFGGGELEVKRHYVSNKCGLLNGVFIREIAVDSFSKDIPAKFVTKRSTLLHRQGASPNNDPKRLYFKKDCKEVYIYQNDEIVDTISGPLSFNMETWYLLEDDDTEVFMFIDKSGNRKSSTQKKNKVNL